MRIVIEESVNKNCSFNNKSYSSQIGSLKILCNLWTVENPKYGGFICGNSA